MLGLLARLVHRGYPPSRNLPLRACHLAQVNERPSPPPPGLLVMLSAIMMAVGGVQAARLLHQALLYNKMRSPQSFFDTTPSGRILNRFSKDVYIIDEVLAPTILMLLNSFYNSISTLVVIVASTPLFAVVILPLAVLYLFLQVCPEWVGVAFWGHGRCVAGGHQWWDVGRSGPAASQLDLVQQIPL